MSGELIEVEVYSYDDPTERLDVLNGRMSPSVLEEIRGDGGGNVELLIDDPKLKANPDLLHGRNLLIFKVDGKRVGAVRVDKKGAEFVELDNGDRIYRVSGSGLRGWLNDAIVHPAGGVRKTSYDERFFNFATERGDWYDSSQWATPTNVVNWGDVVGSPWRYAPAEWPDVPNAKWVWSSNSISSAPGGDNFFRYEFTAAEAAKYSFFFAADDDFAVYIDGQLVQQSEPGAISWSQVSRQDADLEAGDHVFAVRVTNKDNTPAGLIAAVFTFGDPEVPSSATLISYTGKAGDTNWKVAGYPDPLPGWSPGEIMLTLLEEAEARGVRFPLWITPTFTSTLDSYGNPWDRSLDWSFRIGTTLGEVLSRMEELVCDAWIDPETFEFHMVAERGVDRSTYAFDESMEVAVAKNRVGNPKTISGGSTFNASNGTGSFTGTSAVGEVARTNFHRNPGCGVGSTDTQFYWGAGNAATVTNNLAASWSAFGTARRAEFTTVVNPNNGDLGIRVEVAALAIQRRRFTASFWVVGSRTGMVIGPAVTWDANGVITTANSIIARSHSADVALEAGVPVKVWGTFELASTGYGQLRLQVNTKSVQVGDVFEWSMADIYPGDYDPDREVFWGNSAPTEDWTYDWAGTANDSFSRQKYARGIKPVPGAVVRRNLSTNPRATAFAPANSADLRWSNDRWSGRGTFSLVTSASDGPLTPSGMISTYARFTLNVAESGTYGFHHGGNPEAPVVGAGLAVTPGETITVSSYIRRTGDSGNARLSIRFLDGSGGLGTPVHFDVPSVASGVWTRVSGTVVVPAGATRLVASSVVNASVSGTTVDGTGLLVERSGSLGDYFDGETRDGDLRIGQKVYDWEGAANASTSIQRVYIEGGYHRHTSNAGGTQLTQSNAPTGEGSGTRFSVSEGQALALRAKVQNPNAHDIYVRGRFTPFIGTTPTGSVFYGPTVLVPAFGTAIVDATGVVPATITHIAVGVGTVNASGANLTPASGTLLDTTEWAFYSGDLVPSEPIFVSGSLPQRGTSKFKWLGDVNSSPSVMYYNPVVAAPLLFEEGKNLIQASVDEDAEVKNSLLVQTNDGWVVENDPTSVAKYGVLESVLETGASEAVSKVVAESVFKSKADPEEGATYEILPTPGHVPWVDFNVGDWVLAPNKRGELVRRRVMSLAVEEDRNTGQPIYSVEFDTVFRDNEDRISRWLEKLGGGSLGGQFANSGGGSSSPIGRPTVPTTSSPIRHYPAKVQNLSVDSNGLWASNGEAFAEAILEWDPVTSNTDGSATVPVFYEIWGRPTDAEGTTFQRLATATDTEATVRTFHVGSSWTFRVRAMNASDIPGQFSNDVTHTMTAPSVPMSAPTTPSLSSKLGVLVVSWDGKLAGPTDPPPQFRYVYAVVATSSGGTYTRRGATLSRDGRNLYISGLTVGTQYWVKLIAVDGLGMESVASSAASHTLTGVDLGDLNTAVSGAITAAQNAADAAQSTANGAASAASTAQTTANNALSAANGKNKIYYQTAQPSGGTYQTGDLWFDTDDNYKLYTYTGSAWQATQDAAAALAAANTKTKTYYQASAPTSGMQAGDVWFDSDDGNKQYRYSGSSWVVVQDSAIAAAQSAASAAQTTANGKNKVYYQTAQPSGVTYQAGDLWFDTDDNYKLYTYTGSAWQATQDAAGALTAANQKARVFYQTSAPTSGMKTDDLWFDSDDGNKQYRYNGSTWVAIPDAGIAAAQTAASNAASAASTAQSTADGKNTVFYQTSAPSTSGRKNGDVWFDTDDGNQMYVITGAPSSPTWSVADFGSSAIADLAITNAKIADATIQNAKIATLDAAKITTGTLSADRIGANTITTSKLLISSTDELIPNPWFVPTGEPVTTGTVLAVTDPEVPAGAPSFATHVLKINARDNHPFGGMSNIPVRPGEKIYVEAWVAAAPATTRNFNLYMFRSPAAIGGLVAGTSAGNVAPTTTWTKVTFVYTHTTTGAYGFVRPVLQVNTQTGDSNSVWVWYVTGWSARRMATGELIVDGAITTDKLDANSVTAGKIAAGAITAGSAIIADGAITNAKIADGTIQNAKIADATIQSAKIAALDAAKITTGTLAADRIGANSITTEKIASGAVTAGEIAAGAISAGSAIIAEGAIGTAQIADAAITNAKINDLNASKITAGTLNAARIGANSISTTKLLVGSFDNLLQDPGFELSSGTAGWTVTSPATRVTTNPRTGSRSFRLATNASAYVGAIQTDPIRVEPGEEYVFGAWIRLDATSGEGLDGAIELSVSYGADTAANTSTAAVTDSPAVGQTYAFFSDVWVVPAGVKYVKPRIVRRADLGGSRAYLIDDAVFYKRVRGDLIVDGAITAEKLAAEAVTAGKIAAGAVTASTIAAGAITAGHIQAGSITSNEIAARSITGDEIAVGTISVVNLEPSVGSTINLNGNVTITATQEAIAEVNENLSDVNDELAKYNTYYKFGPNGALITSDGDAYSVLLQPDKISLLEGTREVSYWNAGTMYVASFVGEEVILGNHKLEKRGSGTVVRTL